MKARPDLLWLHAAGVARDGHAVLITGPSGSGKSRLATRLIAEGFAYLGDDVLPFDPRTSSRRARISWSRCRPGQCRDFGRHREDAVRAVSALASAVPGWTLSFVDPVRGADAIARAHAEQVGTGSTAAGE